MKTANIIIHGFGGHTNEIEYLAAQLQLKGLETYTVSLAGHGGTKKDLTASSYTDWIASAKKTIDELTPEYQNINLIGFSMGGLISVHFASMPELQKMVFINTPIYYWNIKVILGDIIRDIRNKKFDNFNYYKESVISISVKSCIDFLKLLTKTKKMFKDVLKPSLILQCINDATVYYHSAEYIKKKIGSPANQKYYDGGCHQVFTYSPELRDLLCDDIFNFLIAE